MGRNDDRETEFSKLAGAAWEKLCHVQALLET
jgi:hypothetical protein